MPRPNPTDDLARAAERVAAGDRRAFELLHRRLDPGLRRLLGKRTSDSSLIDDLLQRTWTGVWEACTQGRYDPSRAAISTFIYAVASNTWLRHLRGLKATRGGGMDDMPGAAPEINASAGSAEAIEIVRKLLDGRLPDLSEQERWVIRLAAEGAGDRVIAQRLGISPSTANQAKQSALGKLRRILARAGFRGDSAERDGPGGE